MCRLFGMTSGAEATRATFWLLEARDSLEAQSRRNPDGTGVGIFDEHDRPRVLKQALEADRDLDFAREARELVSRTFVAHVRHATQGGLSEANTHPFAMDGRILAHNGGFGELAALEEHLGDDLATVRGETDSERLFALVTREIRASGDVTEGLVAALDWVAAHLPVLALNVVLTTPDGLWSVRYPETHTLFLLTSDEGPVEHRSDEGTRVSADHAPARVVVASERLDDDPGWEELHSGELVHVGADLTVTRRRVWDRGPARRMPA